MKKLFISVLMLTVFTGFAFAGEDEDKDDHEQYDAQYVTTDCGTTHEIPKNSTDEEACYWLDYYTNQDCY
jgi:hypothetical protein